MDLTILLSSVMIIGSISAVVGYFLMRRKFISQLEKSRAKEEELSQKAYETAVLKEIGDRIGYSLDVVKVIEVISGSLDKLLPYSTVSYMIFDEKNQKIEFRCDVRETVSSNFVKEVKVKMLAAFNEMSQTHILDKEVDESISGAILEDTNPVIVESFFNLPIVILGRLVGLVNVSSFEKDQYNEMNTDVLYRIARQASDDISKLQAVLENEKSRLSQAVESLSDGLLMVDVNYNPVIINQKLTEILGTPKEAEIFDIVNALSGQLDLRTKLEEAVSKRRSLSKQELILKGKILEVVASPVFDRENKRAIGVVVLFHDVTDAKNLEKLRSDFTSMMVHELRAPLTSIKSAISFLKTEGAAGQDSAEYIKMIGTTSEAMLSLVNDLLDVAKMEAGKFDIIVENGNLSSIILDRIEVYKPQAQAKNLKLACDIQAGLPGARFDKVRTKQVLNNLLSNALKFTESGEVRVRAAAEVVNGVPVDILVSVTDTGIGINPEEAGKLFSKFSQLASGRRDGEVKGTGLGLFVAKGIVEGQGGKIWLESAGQGSGSTFYFTVPLAKEEHAETGENQIVFSTKKVAQA